MTIQERLDSTQQRSVAAYLRRQQIEAQRQQLTQAAQQTDLELIRYDGEIDVLTALLKDAPTDHPTKKAVKADGQ